jgi:hypothetical protein
MWPEVIVTLAWAEATVAQQYVPISLVPNVATMGPNSDLGFNVAGNVTYRQTWTSQ